MIKTIMHLAKQTHRSYVVYELHSHPKGKECWANETERQDCPTGHYGCYRQQSRRRCVFTSISCSPAWLHERKNRVKRISTHSFRITLGCKLRAAGCADSTILALCRWQSLKSLEVYCRLTPENYAATLGKARRADARSIQVTSLPDLGEGQDEEQQIDEVGDDASGAEEESETEEEGEKQKERRAKRMESNQGAKIQKQAPPHPLAPTLRNPPGERTQESRKP